VVTGDTSLTRYLFTGREFDPATGLQYNRARWYDASVGRWIAEDPLGFAAGDTNVNRYVGNGPTIATDPSGLQEYDDPQDEEEGDWADEWASYINESIDSAEESLSDNFNDASDYVSEWTEAMLPTFISGAAEAARMNTPQHITTFSQTLEFVPHVIAIERYTTAREQFIEAVLDPEASRIEERERFDEMQETKSRATSVLTDEPGDDEDPYEDFPEVEERPDPEPYEIEPQIPDEEH
jgi:RHS repeat-associated protein